MMEKVRHSRAAMRSPPLRPRFVSVVALKSLIISLVVLLVPLIVIDRLYIPYLEDKWLVSGCGWGEENQRIWVQMSLRNRATYTDSVWSSELWPVSREKSKGKRILIVGDSFVWGDGYSNFNTIWWRQLERELQRRGYKDVEVIAAGLCGVQTDFQLERAPDLLARYKPDMVIWGYVTNDPCGHKGHVFGKPFVKMRHKTVDSKSVRSIRRLISYVLPEVGRQLFRLRDAAYLKKHASEDFGYECADWEMHLLSGENFAVYKTTVNSVAKLFKDKNIPYFFITLPSGSSYRLQPSDDSESVFFDSIRQYHAKRYAPVEPVFKANGIKFVNTLEPFVQSARGDKFVSSLRSPLRLGINPDNGHPGPFCTKFYAVKAADELEAHYQSYLGPRSQDSNLNSKANINDVVPISINLKQSGSESYVFDYPSDKSKMLRMPLRKSFVQLNLENPCAVESIRLKGKGLKKATILATSIDEEAGYDPGIMHTIGTGDGSDIELVVPKSDWARQINSLEVCADVSGNERSLEIGLSTAH
jgi:hypothetical protein